MQTFQLNCLWTCFLLCRAPFCRCMLHSDDDFKNGTPWDQLLCVHQNFCLKMGSSLRKVAILGGFDLSLISYAPLDIDTVLYAYIIYIYVYIRAHLPSDLHIACGLFCFSCSFRGMKRSALKRSFSRPCLQREWKLLRTSLQIYGNSGSGCHMPDEKILLPQGQNITLWGGSLLLRLLWSLHYSSPGTIL